MAKKQKATEELLEVKGERARLTAEESLKRMEAFPERMEQMIASVRRAEVEAYLP